MKTITNIIVMGLLCLVQTVYATDSSTSKDTVVVEFGKNSRMIIIAQSQEDLKRLEKLDINQIIRDLNLNLDSTATGVEEIVMIDSVGTHYTQDTVSTNSDGGLVYYGESSSSDSDEDWQETEWDDDDDNDNDFDFDFWNGEKDDRRTKGSFEIEFGMNNWIEKGKFPDANGALYTVKPWGSWYVALGHTNTTHISGPLMLNWGGNISWYNWKLDNTNVRISKGPDETMFVEDNTVVGRKSKLAATFINLNLVPMLDFGHEDNSLNTGPFKRYGQSGFRIGAGGYVGYRIDSWTKFIYEENGDKQKDKQKSNYYLNNFRYGVRVRAGFRGMDVFMNYDLNNVFAENRGPELNGFSFGIIL
ncbi:hypothetical protein SAMN04488028_101183 [Reichenbachiella agariperforans]|uniref:Outer membrane protein beta-barrel domain-containing protein n=1 Tax=Reichenbachiella agariperforans TaxID=156994 RepID=A0A1M6JGC0_REIAG|nr:hypothetical protein [Reichenbachiella agariperforans]SHJ45741.1 hypothetical protein SAMN04488028_101183 [Reichenbachiella agariperforans]